MPESNPEVALPATSRQTRRALWAVFFLSWTLFVAVLAWWVVNESVKSENTVIRFGPDEVKSWTVRLHETAVLARLHSPWALAWGLLAPYALWVGARYSFEHSQWKRRLAILLASGVGFVVASQWLSARLGAGPAMIVMVNYRSDIALGTNPPAGNRGDNSSSLQVLTNRVTTNRLTKVLVSGVVAHGAGASAMGLATSGALSDLPPHLPPLLAGGLARELPRPLSPRGGRGSAALDGFAYVALIGLAHAGVFHRRYRERERHAAALAARLNEARLRTLQAQLQPHFLFNTLNGIATLLRRDPARAEDMLVSLSELLRVALSTSHRQEIPLREELDLVGRYLAIQKMRFGDRVEFVEEVEPAALDCLVPALLLQPLVENAIRHGLEPADRPGRLRVASARDRDWLTLTVEDDGVGLKSTSDSRTGVGLANVRERLGALHGTRQTLEVTERPEGGVIVKVRLPARTEAGIPSPPETEQT